MLFILKRFTPKFDTVHTVCTTSSNVDYQGASWLQKKSIPELNGSGRPLALVSIQIPG